MDKAERKRWEQARREKLSNRLVLNFGVLLIAAFVLLYVYKFLQSGYVLVTINVLFVLGIIAAVGAIAFFVLGLTKFPKLKNYSAIFLGVFLVCFVYWFATSGVSPFPTNVKWITVGVYAAMAIYFIILAIVINVQLRRLHKHKASE